MGCAPKKLVSGVEDGDKLPVTLNATDQTITFTGAGGIKLEGSLMVPAGAVLLDAWGGAWVYRCDGERFWRARIDPLRRVADDMVIARGPPVGSCVVAVGAVELFGVEFPPGH